MLYQLCVGFLLSVGQLCVLRHQFEVLDVVRRTLALRAGLLHDRAAAVAKACQQPDGTWCLVELSMNTQGGWMNPCEHELSLDKIQQWQLTAHCRFFGAGRISVLRLHYIR